MVLDANLRLSVMRDRDAYLCNLLVALQFADVIKASDEDLDHLGLPGTTTLDKARHLLDGTGAKMMALTLGAQGSGLLARDRQTWWARESVPWPVVDSVGAGDCFLAGLLTAVLTTQGLNLAHPGDAEGRRVLSYALASASLCVMRRGCAPPTRQAVEARTAQVACQFEK